MKADNKIIIACCLLTCLVLSACRQEPASGAKAKTSVFRLFDLFQPADLNNKVTPENAGWKRVEWHATNMVQWTPPPIGETGLVRKVTLTSPIGFRALNDLGGLAVSQNQLAGEITGDASALHFALKENRGGAQAVKFIEVRMNVSGAKKLWLRPEGSNSIDDAAILRWAKQTEPWNINADVVEAKVQTYRFELKPDKDGGPPPAPPAPTPTLPAPAVPSVGPAPAPTAPTGGKVGGLPGPGMTNPPAVAMPPAPDGPGGPGRQGGSSPRGNDLRHFVL